MGGCVPSLDRRLRAARCGRRAQTPDRRTRMTALARSSHMRATVEPGRWLERQETTPGRFVHVSRGSLCSARPIIIRALRKRQSSAGPRRRNGGLRSSICGCASASCRRGASPGSVPSAPTRRPAPLAPSPSRITWWSRARLERAARLARRAGRRERSYLTAGHGRAVFAGVGGRHGEAHTGAHRHHP